MATVISDENGGLRVFLCFVRFLMKTCQKYLLNTVSSDNQIDKPQGGHPKRAELLDVNINTGAQSITVRELL